MAANWRKGASRIRPIFELSVFATWFSGAALLSVHVDPEAWRQAVAASMALLFVSDLFVLGFGLASYFLLLAVVWPAVAFLLFAPYGQSQPLGHSWTLFMSGEGMVVTGYVVAYLLSARMFAALKMNASNLDTSLAGAAAIPRVDRVSTDIFSVIAIVAAYVYQPTIPGAKYGEMDYNLFAGNAWNYICLGSYFFVICGESRSILRRLALVSVPLWLLLHFDRGELIGLLFFWLTTVFNRPVGVVASMLERRRQALAAGLAAVAVLAFTYLGYARLTGMYWSPDVFRGAMLGIANLSTIQQVNHSFAAAVEWWVRFGEYAFVADYPLRLVPSFLANHPPSAEYFIAEAMHTNYGMPFQGEALLSFGVAGLVLAPIVIPFLMRLVIDAYGYALGPLAKAFAFYLVSLLIVRISWYGVFYLPKVMLTVAPLIWLCFAAIRYVQRAGSKVSWRESFE